VTDDSNTADDDPDVLAAEYVLGQLDSWNQQQVARRIETDAGLNSAVYAWADRLQPLADSLPPVEVSSGLWPRIENRLSEPVIVPFRPKWMRTAVIAPLLAVAAGIALVVIVRPFDKPEVAPVSGEAVLASATTREQFEVKFTEKFAQLTVTAKSAHIPAGKSYELWVVPEGGAPKSLGVLAANGTAERHLAADILPQLKTGALLAISLEPAGGSPTGAPTGPVLMSGKITRV
jgi:anti-sigma-K factor RskA